MRYKFRSISELFSAVEPRRFTHYRRNSGPPFSDWIDEYEDRVNLLIERFGNSYLQFPLFTGPEEQRTIYESLKICDKVLCEIRFENKTYLGADSMPSNNYELFFRYTYLPIQGEEEKVENRLYFDSFPNSSHVKEVLINWFEAINVDLDNILTSSQVQTSSVPDDSTFEYDPQL